MGDEARDGDAEAQARSAKLAAETDLIRARIAREQEEAAKAQVEAALLSEQHKKFRRENAVARKASNAPSGRYWFIPTPTHFFQSIGAGLVLAGAFFFLYQPVMESVRTISEEKSNLATIRSAIQVERNNKLAIELKASEGRLQDREKRLKEQEERYSQELKTFDENLRKVNADKDTAIERADEYKRSLDRLAAKIQSVSSESVAERAKFETLAAETKEEAKALAAMVEVLRDEAEQSKRLGERVSVQLERTAGRVFRDVCDQCPEMVVVPVGSFRMGDLNGRGADDERPVHEVRIAYSFAVGMYEVTFDQWDACVAGGGCNGYRPDDDGWGRGRRPVINVSWLDAKAYVGWLSQQTGEKYRLLSAAEWEYACRAGTTTRYAHGDDITAEQANFDGNEGKTTEVGSFPSNPWKLHDMHGNVWEWVEDVWHKDYSGAPDDGSAWTTGGDSDSRVRRGGSWFSVPAGLRSASRYRNSSDFRSGRDGFRVARSL